MREPESRTAGLEPVGLIGLGLMGQGIAGCLIASGLRVTAYSRSPEREAEARTRIDEALEGLVRHGHLPPENAAGWEGRFEFVRSLEELKDCQFVIETVKEDLALKREIYARLEKVLRPDTIVASNTSSIPISLLQEGRCHPECYIGVHWGEPAEIMRYLEIIPGRQTAQSTVERAEALGHACGKDPSRLNFDIRGFVSNRLMYAMLREACFLVESGVADLETVDRSFRNDIGWWATLAGPFRWMDLTGVPTYAVIMEELFPQLCNSAELPASMKNVVDSGGKGISNGKGFYDYTPEQAAQWEKVWLEFTHDIRSLVEKYERRVKF